MKTGGAHDFCFKNFVVVGSFTADGNLLQPTGSENSTPHTSAFSRSQRALVMMCHTTLAQCLCASSHPCVMRLSDCLFSLRSSFCSLHCLSPYLPLLLLLLEP